MLLSKGLTFSSHSAVIAAYGKEFAKTGLLDPKFHRYIIDAQERREIGHYARDARRAGLPAQLLRISISEEIHQQGIH
jgi:uncharacterized protein (UPF0332 family)